MKKFFKIFLTIVISLVIIFIGFYIVLCVTETYSILPIKSKPNKLTFVFDSSFIYNQPEVTLTHYKDQKIIEKYSLYIKNGLQRYEKQEYDLPYLNDGKVLLRFDLGTDDLKKIFEEEFDAKQLYEEGLLITLTENDKKRQIINGYKCYDNYVYFVSGDLVKCYSNSLYEWKIFKNPPKLKKISYNQYQPYWVWYSGWKKNKFIAQF